MNGIYLPSLIKVIVKWPKKVNYRVYILVFAIFAIVVQLIVFSQFNKIDVKKATITIDSQNLELTYVQVVLGTKEYDILDGKNEGLHISIGGSPIRNENLCTNPLDENSKVASYLKTTVVTNFESEIDPTYFQGFPMDNYGVATIQKGPLTYCIDSSRIRNVYHTPDTLIVEEWFKQRKAYSWMGIVGDWLTPTGYTSLFAFELKFQELSNTCKGVSFSIHTGHPLNIINIYPEPSHINSSFINYDGLEKAQKVMKNGLYVYAEDLTLKHKYEMINFVFAAMIGLWVSIIITIVLDFLNRRFNRQP